MMVALLSLPLTVRGGDLLRGGAGYTVASPTQNYSAGTSAAADQARANAADELANTTRIISALQTMQTSVRQAATATARANAGANPNNPGQLLPNVPNGLGIGGLQPAPGATPGASLWEGASLPTQSVSGGATNVTIKQTSQQAVLSWTTFNVGSETHVYFDQSKGGGNVANWIAFNLVTDPSGVPSQILGSISAQGQVYVINQNGIIFGGASQVNVHTLVASSLPINTNLIASGLLSSSDIQFLFSSIALPAGANGTPAFTPPAPSTPDGLDGDITVLAGAIISSPANAENVGGRVVLAGPNVTNNGTILTPDGQTILAAGDQVGFAAHATSDPSLRGLDVYIGAVGPGAGTATNSGIIEGAGADVTIAGKTVNQLGGIEGGTSVSLNGRVDLLADYGAVANANYNATETSSGAPFLDASTGQVTLGASSVIQILPDWSSDATVTGNALALPTQINVQGLAIHLAGDAQIFAPNAQVAVNAGTWDLVLGNSQSSSTFVHSAGQIYLDSGAAIDVAGSTDISASVLQNIISVQLRGAELADSPLQRNGPAADITLNIDSRDSGVWDGYDWVGTPLGNISGYVALIERTVGELTTAGGTVTLDAGGSVVMEAGSKIDVSGGWTNYIGGIVETSKLISDGHIIDISDATPDQIYSGIYTGNYTFTDATYGISENYTCPLALTNAHYEDTYIEGGAGGSITIIAPSMALDGQLLGATVSGPRQLSVPATPSSLSILLQAETASNGSVQADSPTPPRIVFANDPAQPAPAPFAVDSSGDPLPLSADRVAELELSPNLLTFDGFGNLTVQNNDGDISVPTGVALTAAPGGSVTMSAANIDIAGSVTAHGGSIAFTTYNVSPFGDYNTTPAPNPDRGIFTLGPDASLDVSGLIVDDRPSSSNAYTQPLLTSGGSVAISGYTADLLPGSSIDASGGVSVNAHGAATYGAGGAISVIAGEDPGQKGVVGGKLEMDAQLAAYSGGVGGSLTIQAPVIQIGGIAADAGTLWLNPDFFDQGGFTNYDLIGLGKAGAIPGTYDLGVFIAPGTDIQPVAESLVVAPFENDDGQLGLRVVLEPEGVRTPVSLAFDAKGERDPLNSSALIARGDFYMGAGAVIRTDLGASVSIAGDTVAILGSIYAPGGRISVSGGIDSSTLFGTATGAVATVDLGPQSVLSTAGVALLTPNAYGYRTGAVLNGGSISVSGNIFAEAGSLLDVSGASATLDVSPLELSLATNGISGADSIFGPPIGIERVPYLFESNGGSISLTGGQELFSDATLLGNAGGPNAAGGSLQISSGRYYRPGSIPAPTDPNLLVTQDDSTFTASNNGVNHTAIGETVDDAHGAAVAGMGYFGVNDFARGGFSSLTLGGVVQFSGPVSITAADSLDIATGGVIYADSTVKLTAPLVALGEAFQTPAQPGEAPPPFTDISGLPYYFMPTYGAGSLTVNASLIEIGNLSLQDIGKASFIADNGDIVGDGTLDVSGNIYLKAGQIYPPTEVSFTIAAYDYTLNGVQQNGSVTIASSGQRDLPLSAGGTLNIYAADITQGGTLRAPFGTINLGWDGSGSAPVDAITGQSVQAAQNVTLLAHSVTSVSAIDPLTGQALVIPYGINSNGSTWIDPFGADITSVGTPAKAINISGANVVTDAGSVIDLRGGGDLFAYRWVSGNGGTVDILASSKSFAVIPGYGANYAPYAANNNSQDSANLISSDPGYVNNSLAVGERIYLNAGSGLPAGFYTLLPARYALMPGAFLITPQSGAPNGTVTEPDGSTIVAGYEYNSLDGLRGQQGLVGAFEIAPASVVQERAQYELTFASSTFEGSTAPANSGHLILEASQSLSIAGAVLARSDAGGSGGLIDISSPENILIGKAGDTTPPDTLLLDASELSSFDAESLLIGGVRTLGPDSTTVTVTTANLTVDNAGSPLEGSDIILAANDDLAVASGAVIEQTGGASSNAETLLLGTASTPGSGDGTLLRVSSDPNATILRSGIDTSTAPSLSIASGALITGRSVILDSTAATDLNSGATIRGQSVSLDSGQISVLLNNPGTTQPTTGLVLSGAALQGLQGTRSLSLLSYSSIDFYGTGEIGAASSGTPALQTLVLDAGEIRGFNKAGGTVQLAAQTVLLENATAAVVPSPIAPNKGTLAINASVIQLGSGSVAVDQFASLDLNATNGLIGEASGALAANGNVSVTTPLITAAKSVSQDITAAGDLAMQSSGGSSTLSGGLGATMTFTGATVGENTNIKLSSGNVTIEATAGDVNIGNAAAASINVAGVAEKYFDLTEYTSAGTVDLAANSGNVAIAAGSTVNVSAASGGGNAGSLTVTDPNGAFSAATGSLLAAHGAGGTFSLYAQSLPSLAGVDAILNAGNFTLSRTYRAAAGDVAVDGLATAANYNVSADDGSITVTASGLVDASGQTGGTINLIASGSVILDPGSTLTVAAQKFNDAGQGGAVSLEAGSETGGSINPNGYVNIPTGATINLTVAANTAANAALGDFTGTLHIRAPQLASGDDLQVDAIDGTILGASSILVEGYKLYQPAGGNITSTLESQINVDATAFLGAAGQTTAGYTAMFDRLLANNASLAPVTSIEDGAEIINPTDNLTLASNWDLSAFRYGPDSTAGDLVLRAAGNLVFNFKASLSDGFGGASVYGLWDAPLLPAGSSSWSYRLVAGADFSGADYRALQSLIDLAAGSGSLLLGQGSPALPTSGNTAQRSSIIPNYYQTIRTGAGDIGIYAARDVQILNPIATIYTAGSQAPAIANFDTPQSSPVNSTLGASQSPNYPAQYSLGGGNVTVFAQNDIADYLSTSSGLVADSTKELPTNWLYRRGWVDPMTGQFGQVQAGADVESTSWWIDFSNFFEDIGALGGGNVTLSAGHDISNIDAVIPTNARMPDGTPNAASLVELGGGDLTVTAGNDINGGVYYVERGHGTLDAGADILTNSTRAALTVSEAAAYGATDSASWLPTTLFLGSGSFDVTAGGNVLLGPVANPFLLPEGINNGYYDKTYFSTYASTDSVTVSSLGGDVTIKDDSDDGAGSLQAWYQNIFLTYQNPGSLASKSEPWLRLDETNVSSFATGFSLMPPTLLATAFSGDVKIVGGVTLSPSPTGTVDLVAAGSINGLQVNDINSGLAIWASSAINLSDANPADIPGLADPLSISGPAGTVSWLDTDKTLFDSLDLMFDESGAYIDQHGSIQARQALHTPGLLHAGDPNPVHIYAQSGAISGLTLYSAKFSRVIAGQDITDIALYIQNDSPDNISVVSAGGDMILYDDASALRLDAQAPGNALQPYEPGTSGPGAGSPTAGDIQINGPGTIEVLAGRNLDLGDGGNNSDGTGVGITSVGNARDPYLPFDGASIIAAAGVFGSTGLNTSSMDFSSFIAAFVTGPAGARYREELGDIPGLTGVPFDQLNQAQQDQLALDVFFLVLRDAGRDHNDPTSPGYGTYTAGFQAIADLFPRNSRNGNISTEYRNIQTDSGGYISLLAPGGGLTMSPDTVATTLAPPGIITEDGGNISIFTDDSVEIGVSRIFTLRGGNEIIWSSNGDIAAGNSAKTVQTAPPTRVLVDPQSANVQTDLAGLATGGGIGVLATVQGVPPGSVDLIAPNGVINAGDAGIRATGNLNVSAVQILNANNIQAGGAATGVPAPVSIAAPNLAGISAAADSGAAASTTAQTLASQNQQSAPDNDVPSIITVEVLGYGGPDTE